MLTNYTENEIKVGTQVIMILRLKTFCIGTSFSYFSRFWINAQKNLKSVLYLKFSSNFYE
jgi:hypothetical protein